MKINIGVFCALIVSCTPYPSFLNNFVRNWTRNNLTDVHYLPELQPLVMSRSTSENIVFQPVQHTFDYRWDDSDTYFDRVVFLRVDKVTKKKEDNGKQNNKTEEDNKYKEIISTGVFITERHVLTSFNPFRELLPILKSYDVVVAVLRDRTIINDTYTKVTHLRINCARQIIPLLDIDMKRNAWHGVKFQRHTPLHDLMIARVAGTMRFTNMEKQTIRSNNLEIFTRIYSFVYPTKNITAQYLYDKHSEEYYKTKNGPYLINAAEPNATTEGKTFRFASIAFEDDDHIKESKELRTKTFSVDALVDCEEYLIPEWGEFICIRDDNNYPGIGSGSILLSGDSVYGIGSFKITKSGVSLYVFTDVRKYNHLLFKTCTADDHLNILDEQDYNFYNITVNIRPVLEYINWTAAKDMSDDQTTWCTFYWQYTL